MTTRRADDFEAIRRRMKELAEEKRGNDHEASDVPVRPYCGPAPEIQRSNAAIVRLKIALARRLPGENPSS